MAEVAFGGTGYVDAPVRTFTAGEALEQFDLVKLNAAVEGSVVRTTLAADRSIGVAGRAVALGAEVPVILLNKQGTVPMCAETVIAFGAAVEASEGAAAGKVTTLGAGVGGLSLGLALKTTAIGEKFEVLNKK